MHFFIVKKHYLALQTGFDKHLSQLWRNPCLFFY